MTIFNSIPMQAPVLLFNQVRYLRTVVCFFLLTFHVTAQGQIEEIIVTAQKRTESIQDVDVAISAITGDVLDDQRIVQPRDLFTRMPNISVQANASAAQLQLGIRGVSFATFSPLGTQPVMMFQDEVVLNSFVSAGLFIHDLERVEVLRGPQNTLYGRNTTGGAVNFISRQPEIGGGTNGYADISYGNFDSIEANAAIGGELGSNAAYRLAFQSLNTDGYWDNVAIPGDEMGERNQHVGRAQFKWEPNDSTRVLLNIHGGVSEGGQRPYKHHSIFDATGAPCADLDIDNLSSTCPTNMFGAGITDGLTPLPETDEAVSELRNDIDDVDMLGGFLRLEKDFDNFTIMSLTGYEDTEYDHWDECDGANLPVCFFRQKSDQEQWSQEIRLTSADDLSLRWIAGGYFFFEDADYFVGVPFFDPGSSMMMQQDTEMYSVFGEIEKDFGEGFTFTLGFRYVNEKKNGEAFAQCVEGIISTFDIENPDNFLFEPLSTLRAAGPTPGCPFTSPLTGGPFSESWDLWGGNVGISYQINDDARVYAHVSRGEKGGQFTTQPEGILQGTLSSPAEPEEVITYEAGFKSTWADNKVQTNLAAFYNDYTNQQLQITVATAVGLASTLLNAAESETWGVEFDGLIAPGNHWLIDFAVGYLQTEVKKDITGQIEVGRNLTNAPKWTLNMGVTKDWHLTNGNTMSANLNMRYTDEREFDLIDTAANRHFSTDPSYTVLNAHLKYEFGSENQYRISAWGKNLTDELYNEHIQQFGLIIVYPGNPRQFGVSVGMDF